MTALKTTKGIVPGKILYYVNGSSLYRKKGYSIDSVIEKYIITSPPRYWYNGRISRNLFVSTISGHFSINDCGIDNKKQYNLNRLFGTKEEAAEFVGQCILGKFFDTEDQRVYDDPNNGYWYAPYIPIQIQGQNSFYPTQTTTMTVLKHRGNP